MHGDRIGSLYTVEDAACPCGCGFIVVNPLLVDGLEILAGMAGCPLTISSWCRCAKHNKARGGVPGSQHLYGTAVDGAITGMTPWQVVDLALKISVFRQGGIGLYKTFVHLDVRESGPARFGPNASEIPRVAV